jgi:hypothetical protein
MADRKISDLTALTTPASGDFLPIVDISEAAAASKNKSITIEELMRGVPDGTAAAPGIAFETDPNTGIYSPGADQLAVATNGTQRLLINASGNVEIKGTGTNSGAVFSNQDGRIGLYFRREADGALTSGIYDLGAGSSSSIQINARTNIVFSSNSTEYLRINGVGQTMVNSAGSAAAPVISKVDDTNTGIFFPAADTIAFAEGGAERMRITSDAYVRLASGTGGIQFNGDTAAANALDDYEEGTWTPTLVPDSGSFTSITYNPNRSGAYTKIGNCVVLQIFMFTNAITVGTASGSVSIGGLPFIPSTVRCSGALQNVYDFAASNAPEAIGNVGTSVYLWKRTTAGGSQSILQVSDLSTGATDNSFHATFVYYV